MLKLVDLIVDQRSMLLGWSTGFLFSCCAMYFWDKKKRTTLELNISQLQQKNTTLQLENSTNQKKIVTLLSENAINIKKFEILQSENTTHQKIISSLQSEITNNQKKIEILQSEYTTHKETLQSENKKKIDILQSENENFKKKIDILQSENENFKKKIDILQSENEIFKKKILEMEKLQDNHKGREKEIKEVWENRHFLEDKVGRLQMEIERKNCEIQDLSKAENQNFREKMILESKLVKKTEKMAKLDSKLIEKTKQLEEVTMELNYLRNLCDNLIEYLENQRMNSFTEEESNVDDVLDDIENIDPSDNFKELKQIAEGGCGNIFQAVDKNGKKVAIKEISIDEEKVETQNTSMGVWKTQIRTEIGMLKKLVHENIIGIIGAYFHSKNNSIWLVLELMDCSLTEILYLYDNHDEYRLTEPIMARVFVEVLQALEFMHSQNIIHRDLKSDNILINTQGKIKLGDFGMSCYFTPDEEKRIPPVIMGTIYWLAPEITNMEFFGYKGDIWSLGIVGREMISGIPPYIDQDEHPDYRWPLLAQVAQGPPHLDSYHSWSPTLCDFLDQCLTVDYDERPSASKLLQHKFCREACNLDSFVKFVGMVMLEIPKIREKDS